MQKATAPRGDLKGEFEIEEIVGHFLVNVRSIFALECLRY